MSQKMFPIWKNVWNFKNVQKFWKLFACSKNIHFIKKLEIFEPLKLGCYRKHKARLLQDIQSPSATLAYSLQWPSSLQCIGCYMGRPNRGALCLTQRASNRSSPSWAPVRLSRLACWHVREAGASVPNCFSSIAIHGRSQHQEIEARFVDLVKLEEYRTCPKASLFLPLMFFLYYLDLEVTHPSGLLLSTAPPPSCHFSMSRKGCNMSLALAIYLMEHQCSSNAANFNGQILWSGLSFFRLLLQSGWSAVRHFKDIKHPWGKQQEPCCEWS